MYAYKENNSPEKYMYLTFASQTYREVNSYPRYQWASKAFPKINVKVVGLPYAQLIKDIYFKNR